MTKRSTRNKLRAQGFEAEADLKRAQNHLVQLGALADERSKYIDDNLPVIVTTLDILITTVERFNEGL